MKPETKIRKFKHKRGRTRSERPVKAKHTYALFNPKTKMYLDYDDVEVKSSDKAMKGGHVWLQLIQRRRKAYNVVRVAA